MARTLIDGVATRIQSLKDSIESAELSEDVKYQTAFTYYIRSECNVPFPLQAQKLYMQKMKRFFLQDDNEMTPQEFFKVMQQANDLLPYIQPTTMTANLNERLTEFELMTAFCQSLPPDWEIEAKTTGRNEDQFKLFSFLNSKHKEQKKEKNMHKKRKAEERNIEIAKRQRPGYNITNMQDSQYNYNRRSDTSTYSGSSRGFHRGRGFRGRGFYPSRGGGRSVGGDSRGRGHSNFSSQGSFQSRGSSRGGYSRGGYSQHGSQRPYHNSIEEINLMQHHNDDLSSVSHSQY